MFLAAVCAIICLSAFSFFDGMSGGYAIAYVSFVLAIICLAVSALFYHRAKVMESILNSMQLLAHWVYSSAEAEKSARREYDDYQERNRAMFIIIGGMLIVASFIMIILAGDGGIVTGLFLLTFTVILFIVSRVAPILLRHNALRAPRDAYIAENGIIYEGTVYPFRSFLARMDEIKFKKRSGKKPPVLIFSFIQLIGINIRSSFDIEIPVPKGEEETACKIADMLGNRG
jgi:hypothetical protein